MAEKFACDGCEFEGTLDDFEVKDVPLTDKGSAVLTITICPKCEFAH